MTWVLHGKKSYYMVKNRIFFFPKGLFRGKKTLTSGRGDFSVHFQSSKGNLLGQLLIILWGAGEPARVILCSRA